MRKGGIYVVTKIIESVREFLTSPEVIIFGSLTLVEFIPIKLNPLRWTGRKIGELLIGDLRKEFAEFKRDYEERNAKEMRRHILDFANSCRNGVLHSREEWEHIIAELREYEEYTEKKKIPNGVIEEDAKYLRELYRERNMKNDFL